MSPALAGAVGGAVILAYLPSLGRQLRNGAVQVGHLGVRPVLIHRDKHPLAFRIGAGALIALTGALLIGCGALIVRGTLA